MKTPARWTKVLPAVGLTGLIVFALVTASTAAFGGTTFNNPRATTATGSTDQIWITAGNGFAYCKQRGFRTMENFTGTCGEDESSYLDHQFATDTWVFRSSGSKNGCYPLFASITCR